MTPPVRIAIVATLGAIVAAAIIVPLGQYLYGLAAAAPWFASLGPALGEASFTFLIFGALLGVAVVGRTFDTQRAPLIGPGAPIMLGTGLAIGAGGLFAAYAFAMLANATRVGEGLASAILIGTLSVAFQATVEEVYFRGWLQPIIVRAAGPVAGIAAVAFVFALLHLAGGERSPVSLVNLFLGGILFGVLALRSDGLALPTAAHVAWNWSEIVGLGLDPNPGVGSFGALADRDIVGTALWGGSAEGLNASIGVTFALAALIVPAAVWRSKLAARRLIPAASPG